MQDFTSSDLKAVIHSKRANLYYLEHCRVLVNGGRVEYVTEGSKASLYWNIPIANTTTLILGTGTSVTQAAVRELANPSLSSARCVLNEINSLELLCWAYGTTFLFARRLSSRPVSLPQTSTRWVRPGLGSSLRMAPSA